MEYATRGFISEHLVSIFVLFLLSLCNVIEGILQDGWK